jgi:hypothetical protein
MKRREFITLLGGAAVAWPFAAHAQQPAIPMVGFLGTASPRPFAHLVAGFRRGLQETGFIEGRSVVIEYRWAEGQYDRVPASARTVRFRLVRQRLDFARSIWGLIWGPVRTLREIIKQLQKLMQISWRRGWDSNPRGACAPGGFQVRSRAKKVSL